MYDPVQGHDPNRTPHGQSVVAARAVEEEGKGHGPTHDPVPGPSSIKTEVTSSKATAVVVGENVVEDAVRVLLNAWITREGWAETIKIVGEVAAEIVGDGVCK